jgi:putative DNA primase/helicase
VASTVSSGRLWPGGAANGHAGDVIILAAEDNAADTLVPRLIAAGADLTNVHVVKAVKGDDGVERAFNLAVDLDRLEQEYDLQRVRLLVVDPVSAYLGTAKSTNHGADVRTVLGRFAMFAARHDLGGLAIAHLNKTSGARAITRIMGSLEWVAAPRAVFLVTEEAGTDRRLFVPLKNNLACERFGYAFGIEAQGRRPRHQDVGRRVGSRTSYDHRRRGSSRRSQGADVGSDRFPRASAQRRSG